MSKHIETLRLESLAQRPRIQNLHSEAAPLYLFPYIRIYINVKEESVVRQVSPK